MMQHAKYQTKVLVNGFAAASEPGSLIQVFAHSQVAGGLLTSTKASSTDLVHADTGSSGWRSRDAQSTV